MKKVDPTKPGIIVRVEGVAMFVVALLFYQEVGQGWLLFFLLFLVPDLCLLGYLRDAKVGAIAYNVVHTYLFPAGLFSIGFLAEQGLTMGLALIWAAHIAIDRALGFGLKYPTAFRPTHLQRL